MKGKKLLTASMALLLAVVPTFAGCEAAFEKALIGVLTGFEKAPDPTIKEGKFNFSVTYEYAGEETTVSSVFVCKFAESGMFLSGWYIDWDSYVEDDALQQQILNNYSGGIFVDEVEDGTIYLDLYLFATYFMAEPGGERLEAIPSLFILYNEDVAEEKGYQWENDPEILESYGAKIIHYEYDAPVENIYK